MPGRADICHSGLRRATGPCDLVIATPEYAETGISSKSQVEHSILHPAYRLERNYRQVINT